MMRLVIAVGVVFVIMNVSMFLAYGTLAAILAMEPSADGSTGRFFASVLVVKLGLAGGFVALYHLAREIWSKRWPTYAVVWWGSFVVIEIGQAIGPGYSWSDAGGGVIAKAIYFPLAALFSSRFLAVGEAGPGNSA
jgi:hypothetical protein